MDLLQHRSRWGGAVHFALAATSTATEEEAAKPSLFKDHFRERVGGLTNSYIPTVSKNKAILDFARYVMAKTTQFARGI